LFGDIYNVETCAFQTAELDKLATDPYRVISIGHNDWINKTFVEDCLLLYFMT